MTNPIGTINVQIGNPTGPKVPSITTSKALKNSTDLDMNTARDNYVIVYKQATNSFVMAPVSGVTAEIDAGTF